MYGRQTGPGVPVQKRKVEFWTQPLFWWLVANAYHWYDMRIYKVPGFKRLENWLWKGHEDELFYMPLSCRQDLRCYDLDRKKKTVLAELEIDEETYEKVKRP